MMTKVARREQRRRLLVGTISPVVLIGGFERLADCQTGQFVICVVHERTYGVMGAWVGCHPQATRTMRSLRDVIAQRL